jgi:uncharacterized membrane protein
MQCTNASRTFAAIMLIHMVALGFVIWSFVALMQNSMNQLQQAMLGVAVAQLVCVVTAFVSALCFCCCLRKKSELLQPPVDDGATDLDAAIF